MSTSVRPKLASALFGKVRWSLLTLFFNQPDQSFYLREIARIVLVGHGAIQRELASLVNGEILIQEKRGRQIYFQANHSCPVYKELRAMIVKTTGIAEILKEKLSPFSTEIELAFIYGSQANGTARAESDVDLLVVGDVNELSLHKAVTESERRIQRPVNYMLLSREEYHRRSREKQGFLVRILESEKISIIRREENVRRSSEIRPSS